MDMKRDWPEFARKLAEGARAKLTEDRQRQEATETQPNSRLCHADAPVPAR